MDIEIQFSDIQKFAKKFPKQSLVKNQTLLQPYSKTTELYFLDTGIFRSVFINSSDEECTVNFFKPGSIFPLTSFLSDQPNPYSFISYTDSTVYKIHTQKLLEFFQSHPDFYKQLSISLSSGIEGFAKHAFSIISGNAREKIASVLLMLADRFGTNSEFHVKINLPLTDQIIASLASLTREKVNTEMNYFINQKWIIKDRKNITIVNRHPLTALVMFQNKKMY